MKILISLLSVYSMIATIALAQPNSSEGKPKSKPITKLPQKKLSKPVGTENSDGQEVDTNGGPTEKGKNQIHVETSNAIRLNYGYPLWNKSPAKIDAASMIMREGSSGRLVQIHLVETAPDSSIFSGLYSITFQNVERLKVDFYVPPQNLLETAEGLKKIATMITKGQLRRNPFILRRTPTGAQTIEVFDTRDQAVAAMKAYRVEQQLQGLQAAKVPSDQQVEMARLTRDLQEKEAAAHANAERIRLEQLEAARIAALMAKEAALNAAEKARRKQEAETIAADAMNLFKSDKFPESVAKFEKAVELDPDNRGYYFQYGVALYKVENHNKSLIYIKLAEGPQVDPVEKNFFISLNHFKLREFPTALASFDKVIEAKHPEMSPAAQFYKGMVYFEEKNWEEAKKAFQTVLDTSKDSQLDQRAESYIEQILRIQQFELERSRKWQFSATIGEQFDSNVTLLSDSSLSQGTQTNAEGNRTLFQGSGRYRPVYDETREFAIQLDLLSMYTFDKSFQYLQTLRNADPNVATLTFPWTRKGLLFGKGHKLDIIPGYESIWMSVENNTNKEIISSVLLNVTNLLVMNDSLYSNFNLELRRDQSQLSSSTGDDDSTAIKVKLLNSNLHFLTEDKVKILTTEGALTLNQAQGKNSTYNRLDLGVGYIQPFYWDTSGTVKLSYFFLNYPEKAPGRTDNSYTLTSGLSKKLNDVYSTGFVASYNINSSNTDSNTYKKWTAMLTLSALKAF